VATSPKKTKKKHKERVFAAKANAIFFLVSGEGMGDWLFGGV
jgi:hypothetical protein